MQLTSAHSRRHREQSQRHPPHNHIFTFSGYMQLWTFELVWRTYIIYGNVFGAQICNTLKRNWRTLKRHKGYSTSHYSALLTYLLTPWCRVLLEKLTGLQLVKKFPAFHGTRRLITALTSVRHLSLSWASPIQSIYPHPTFWRSVLILSTHLRLGLPSGLLPSGFPTKTLYTPLSSPIRATCPAHIILLDFITCTILGEEYKSFSSSLCNLLHSPVHYSALPMIKVWWRRTIYSNEEIYLMRYWRNTLLKIICIYNAKLIGIYPTWYKRSIQIKEYPNTACN